MLNGAFALLEQSLRLDSRSRSTHWLRLILCVAIYISLCMTVSSRFPTGAPGLQFLEGIAYLDLCFLTLLGIGLFSTAITEEKEEDTLGLMMMAGINPIGILAGKTGGRLCQALLLVAVQYPFMLLAVTMGGVMPYQIWSITVALLAYVVFLAGLGLLCSTIAPRNRASGTLMIIGLAAYVILPLLVAGLAALHTSGDISWTNGLHLSASSWNRLSEMGELSVFVRMSHILATGFNDPAFGLQFYSNVVAGLAFAALSWALFGIATRSPSTEANSRGLLAQGRSRFGWSAGRCWTNPFLWKDFYFVAGGFGTILIRTLYYLALVFIARCSEPVFGVQRGMWAELCLIWIMFSLPVDAALLMARSMHDEVRAQTLSALMMLPRSSNGIVYSKVAGALLGFLPGIIVGACVLLGSQAGREGLHDVFKNREGWIVPLAVLYFALVPNYAALTALYVRWGAVPLAIGLTIATYFVLSICIGIFLMVYSGPPSPSANLGFAMLIMFLGIALLAINVACHIGVLFRVQALAEK